MTDNKKLIVVAGATGQLGKLIVKHLANAKVPVKALVRNGAAEKELVDLDHPGVEVVKVDYNNKTNLENACKGASCIISALSGLRDVIIDTQTKLLAAAVSAGVPRFIPSDYSIDYTKLPHGQNRNLDLRREFSTILDSAPIKSTSILNGMFTDLLLDAAPIVLFKVKRIFYWGDADQPMDFTTIDNTAEFTAAAAADDSAPRFLRVAGHVATMHDVRQAATVATGEKFKMLRPGGLGAFKMMIKFTKTVAPGKDETFPAWQGMQYMYDMLTGVPKFSSLDNERYSTIHWKSIQDVLKTYSPKH